MQIVIDIDDEDYKRIQDVPDVFNSLTSRTYSAIKNGTLLPKEHGRLGDLDALREEVSSWGMNDYEPSDFIDEIDMADVIIEADKVESEGI